MTTENIVAVDAAIDWMIALQDAPENSSLHQEFETWRTANIDNERAWDEVMSTRDIFRSAVDESYVRDAHLKANTNSNLEKQPIPFQLFSRQTIAAIFSIFIIGTFVYAYPTLSIYLQADHITGAGEVASIQLEDRSRVDLDTNSAIKVSFETGIRKIELLSGRAYFDVQKDPSRPFKVKFGTSEVTVLGTAFEIDISKPETVVSVEHGSVAVEYKAQTDHKIKQLQQLSKGDQLRIDEGEVSKLNLEPSKVAQWREGKLVVDNWLVKDVFAELDRYYPGVVLIKNQLNSKHRITGVYNIKTPVDAIKLVAATEGLVVHQLTPWVLLISKL